MLDGPNGEIVTRANVREWLIGGDLSKDEIRAILKMRVGAHLILGGGAFAEFDLQRIA
jgi:hypothetical protein